MLDETTNFTTKFSHLNVIIFFFFLKLLKINCEDIECKKNTSLLNTNCFNNILLFNEKKYRSGHFATNKKGDLILEFSEDIGSSINNKGRLFYGLKKDGRYFFDNEKATYEFDITGAKISNSDTTLYYGRFEARNLFVSLGNDNDNEYLFSVSSYDSVVELHNITNENNNHNTWFTTNFFNLSANIHSFEYSLFEIKDESTYIIAFVPITSGSGNDERGDAFIIKKFRFKSFSNDAYEEINITQYNQNYNNRIISAFSMDDCNIIVVFFFKKTKTESNNEFGKYALNFYDYNLNLKYSTNISDEFPLIGTGNGIFFRGFYLKEKYLACIFFTNQYNGNLLNFQIRNFLVEGVVNYGSNPILTYNISTINFNTDIIFSDFLKIDE